jgi:hypothetical protein
VERWLVEERWFTPRTARQALHSLRPRAEALCRLYRQLERDRPPVIGSDQRVEPAYFALLARLHATAVEIRRRGVWVQDLRRGLLGFPARRAGRPVVLSWYVGEPTLDYWQDPGDGTDGRRPVDEDGPWEAV